MRKFKGRLNKDQLADFDSLLLKLKEINGGQTLEKGTVIPLDKMAVLPDDENRRLWEYIKHYSKLVVMYPKNLEVVRGIHHFDDTTSLDVLIDEATMDVAIWVYRFAWRQYRHSEDCGYVFTTGGFGFQSWAMSRKTWSDGVDSYKSSVDEADHDNDAKENEPERIGTRFSELDFPLSIDDLESSMTNP